MITARLQRERLAETKITVRTWSERYMKSFVSRKCPSAEVVCGCDVDIWEDVGSQLKLLTGMKYNN